MDRLDMQTFYYYRNVVTARQMICFEMIFGVDHGQMRTAQRESLSRGPQWLSAVQWIGS